MRIVSIIGTWVVVGCLIGVALAYVEVKLDQDALGRLPGDLSGPEMTFAKETAPRVQVDNPHFDFGRMQRGTTRSHEFVIRNVGKSALKLRVGGTSCKCTLGEVSDKPVEPGQSTTVKMEWSAKSDSGPFRQTATIFTNDPLQSQIELVIDGQIMATSGVEPPEVVFDKMSVGESKSAQVYVMAMLQDDLTVSDAVLSDPTTRDKFDVKIEPVEPAELPNKNARRGVRVTITSKGDLPVGRFNQWLSLRTNLPEAEKLDIPVIGRVVGDISVHGPRWNEEHGAVTIGSVKSGEGGKAKVNIVVRGSDAAKIEFALLSKTPDVLKVTLGQPQQLKPTLVHLPVEIEVPAGTGPMVHLDTAQGEAGKIVLSTTHPKIKELSLGVRFAVER
jgi:hypothetical protein